MSLQITETVLGNIALGRLGETSIVDINERSPQAEKCRLHWPLVRDALLRQRDWAFTRKQATLTALPDAPPFGYAKAFQLPQDYVCLRRLNCRDTNAGGARLEVIGTALHCDDDSAEILYTRRIETVTLWDSSFCDAFAILLAAAIAPSITNATSLAGDLRKDGERAAQQALGPNAHEAIPRAIMPWQGSGYLAARHGVGPDSYNPCCTGGGSSGSSGGGSGGSGTSGAPVNASYLTLGTDATLTAERVLTAGENITLVDGGAGGALTISAAAGGGGGGGAYFYRADANSQAANDPGAGKVRWDNATQASATALYFDWLTDDDMDIHVLFELLNVSTRFVIQDRDLATHHQIWEMSGAVIPHPDWFEVPVTFVSGSGSFQFSPNQQLALLIGAFDPAVGSGGAPTNALYVTLAANATLTGERVLTAGNDIAIVDGGAGSTVTVNVDFGEQTPNTVYAGPDGGGPDNPAFRALADGDIPSAIARDSEVTTALAFKVAKAGDTMTGALLVPDDPYAAGWNGSAQVPTKNAVYDKIESLSVGGGAPTTASYVTLATDGTLTSERVLTAGTNITITDGGAGSTITVALATPLVTPALGTPASGILTNCTGTASGLTAGTASAVAVGGITGLGTGVATWLATPSSANLAAAVTGETGSGALVFATSPALVTPALGTPASGTLTSCTGLPVSTGISGFGTGVATALAINVGSAGAPVVLNGALGTPSSGNLTSCTADGTNAVGYRNVPLNAKTGSYTLLATDVGKVVPNTTGGWTVNNSVHAAGDVVLVYNDSASSQNITAGTITTMRLAGTATTGTRALAARGIATLYFQTASECIVSGSGVT